MKTSKFFTIGIAALAFIVPLFFLPLTSEFYVFNKTSLLYFAVGLLLIGWGVKAYFAEKFEFLKPKLSIPVLGLMLVYLLSTLIQAPNRLMSLQGTTGVILVLGILFFVIINNIKSRKEVKWILVSLIVVSVVLSWFTVFAYLGLTENIGPDWMKTKAWTPTGSPLTTLSFMLALLPATLYWAFNSKGATEKILLFLASSLQILGSILVVSLFAGKTIPFIYLPPQFGWQIAVDGFKTLKTGLLGAGPGNFPAAFSQFRPAALNSTSVWTIRFGSNSNEYFNLLSSVGVLGFISYVLIALGVLRKQNFKGRLLNKVLYIFLASSFIIQLITSANFLLLFVTFIGLALFQVNKLAGQEMEVKTIEVKNKYTVWTLAGLGLVLALAVFFFQGRVWLADKTYMQSLQAAAENKGIDTYNLQVKAIGLNPFNEGYRITYAQTNFALANSLAAKEDLTDQDRANINQLLSQAVREAKAAADLNPQLSSHWANLAGIYRNLINVAAQADQWSIAAYLQAVQTDPTNPILRINFGGLYFSLQDFDRAIEQFRVAVNLKPDYANAYYNLAAAYSAKEDWVQAYLNMQTAISLVPADSPDRTRVLEEFAALEEKLPQQPQAATGAAQLQPEQRLTQPTPIPTPQPGFGQITLPEEAAPEIPSPEPTPEATPEASQEASPSSEFDF
ncbi:tetratricopeptide repeat protein [Patescibacteria group bacterium]